MLVAAFGSLSAQSAQTGSIVGWGIQVVGADTSAGVTTIAAGTWHSLGLREDGSVAAWGENHVGQCNVPAPNSSFVAITAGYWHSLALKEDGSITAWGANYFGQCNVPAPNSGFVAIAAGEYHNLGLKDDGSIAAWGRNFEGQCDVPAPNSGLVAIAAGGDHSLGLKDDGSVVAWGAGQPEQSRSPHYGQCDVPSPNTDFVAIAAGGCHSLGLKEDGSVAAWGDNEYGQCNVPAPNSGFVAITVGNYHSLGLKDDGSIKAWGSNHQGQCNVPAPNSGFAGIAAGYGHSLGLKEDGSVIAWGSNHRGQCNVGAPNSGFIAISAGESHSLALVGEVGTGPVANAGADQVVYAWIDGMAEVGLDGSGSFDADGDELDYFWFEGVEQIATGVDPNVELAVGVHTIELIVNDGFEDSEPNEVVITVIGPIEADVHIVPRVVNRNNHLKRVIAIIRLPEGIGKGDVVRESFELYAGGLDAEPIGAIWQRVIGWGNMTRVFALFDKGELMNAIPNDGRRELTVVGRLESGQYIYGSDTVRIVRPRRRGRGLRRR